MTRASPVRWPRSAAKRLRRGTAAPIASTSSLQSWIGSVQHKGRLGAGLKRRWRYEHRNLRIKPRVVVLEWRRNLLSRPAEGTGGPGSADHFLRARRL